MSKKKKGSFINWQSAINFGVALIAVAGIIYNYLQTGTQNLSLQIAQLEREKKSLEDQTDPAWHTKFNQLNQYYKHELDSRDRQVKQVNSKLDSQQQILRKVKELERGGLILSKKQVQKIAKDLSLMDYYKRRSEVADSLIANQGALISTHDALITSQSKLIDSHEKIVQLQKEMLNNRAQIIKIKDEQIKQLSGYPVPTSLLYILLILIILLAILLILMNKYGVDSNLPPLTAIKTLYQIIKQKIRHQSE